MSAALAVSTPALALNNVVSSGGAGITSSTIMAKGNNSVVTGASVTGIGTGGNSTVTIMTPTKVNGNVKSFGGTGAADSFISVTKGGTIKNPGVVLIGTGGASVVKTK